MHHPGGAARVCAGATDSADMSDMSSSAPTARRFLALTTWVLAVPLGGTAVLATSDHPSEPVVSAAGPVADPRLDQERRVPPAPSTTAAPTTTTTVAPTTTAAPAPPPAPPTTSPTAPPAPPPPTPAPAPAPAPAPTAVPSAEEVYRQVIPSAWRAVFSVRFEHIAGNTSWASSNGTIKIAERHRANRSVLAVTIAHEFGHLIAWRYGTQAYNGAPPSGWPAYSQRPEEAWGDCVSQVFTGIIGPSHGLPPCGGSSLSWTHAWLGSGPNSHPVTG